MPVKSSPEVFNSRGKVGTTRSLPTQADLRGSTSLCGLNIRNIVGSLMQDVKTGVPLHLVVSTKLRQLALSDSSQLTLLLSEILNYSLQTSSIELGVYVVVHFNPRKHFSQSLLDAITTLVDQRPDDPQLPALLVSLCHDPHLLPQASALSLLVVEKLLCWVSSTLNVREDLERIGLAQKLLDDTAGFLVQFAPSGLRLFSRQVRATLLGGQAGRTVCRDRLIDLFAALNRLKTSDGNGYIVDTVDDCNNVGSTLNVRLLKPMDFKPRLEEENNLDSEVVVENENNSGGNAANAREGISTKEKSERKLVLDCDKEEAVVKKRNQSEDSEENMMSLQSALKSENTVEICEPQSPRFVDTYNDDLEKLREAVSKKKSQSEESEEDMLSLQNVLGSTARLDSADQELGILGHLVDPKGESHPMADGSLIGRDPQCQLHLSSKTVSRKHAKIVRLEDGGAALQLLNPNSKVNNKVNGQTVEDETPLKQGDEIQISKDILVWHNAEIEKDPGFVSCLEPREEAQ